VSEISNLISKKELIAKFPALGERKYRIEWLTRTRQIPVIKIGNRIYFDETKIEIWISEHSIPAQNGKK